MSGASGHGKGHHMGQALAIWGLILGVVGIVIGVFVPEVRCFLGIDHCPASNPAASSSATRAPDSRATTVVEAPADPNLPFFVDPPTPHQIKGRAPYVELSLEEIVNRGKAVVVAVSGSGFTTSTGVRLNWDLPDGSTYLSDVMFADDRGLFSTKLLWSPFQYLGIEGNNGVWKMTFEDKSGKVTANQVFVKSDDKTPPPSEWESHEPLTRSPLSNPSLSIGFSGTLCGKQNLLMDSTASGFTPEATGELSYFRPDGKRIGSRGVGFNAIGELDLVQDWWATRACSQNQEFRYRVVLVEDVSGRRAEAFVDMPTND